MSRITSRQGKRGDGGDVVEKVGGILSMREDIDL
jgi:hypothetical protein